MSALGTFFTASYIVEKTVEVMPACITNVAFYTVVRWQNPVKYPGSVQDFTVVAVTTNVAAQMFKEIALSLITPPAQALICLEKANKAMDKYINNRWLSSQDETNCKQFKSLTIKDVDFECSATKFNDEIKKELEKTQTFEKIKRNLEICAQTSDTSTFWWYVISQSIDRFSHYLGLGAQIYWLKIQR